MPVIRISDACFVDLKYVSTWLETKSPSATIEKLVADKMEELGLERDIIAEQSEEGLDNPEIIFRETPGLSFTKVIYAQIGNHKLESSTWAAVLIKTITILKEKGHSSQNILKSLNIPARLEKFEEKGYKYYPVLGISIQGQSGPDAWAEASRLARMFDFPIKVKFRWMERSGAQHPGKVGILNQGFSD